jgi:type II secretory pathway component PulJ
MTDLSQPISRRRAPRIEIAVLLVATGLFLMVALQTYAFIRGTMNLSQTLRTQEPLMQEATKVRQQLDAIAGATAQLAESGDPGAKAIVDDLRRQGIAVKPPP